jgi:hypothetical protein
LGFPIYDSLCTFESGTKIYKTVDNVEGFYVGEKRVGSEPIEPYEGYKFVDYQEVKNSKSTGKYYRSYWVDYFKDREIANMCVYPLHPKYTHYPYTKSFNSGKCIVKEEIAESEVSRWEYSFETKNILKIPILKLEVSRELQFLDRQTKEIKAIGNGVWWQGGWLYGIFSSIEVGSGGTSCDGNINYIELKKEVLKPKKQEEK